MKYLTLLLLFTISIIGNTQVLSTSEEIPLNSDIAYDVIGELGNHILLFRDGKTEFTIQAFNQQLRESWNKKLTLDKRLPKVLGVIAADDEFTVVYSFRQKGNTIIKAHRYDPAANLIDSSTLVNLGYLFFTPRFQLLRSEDRSKLLLYYVENQDIIHSYTFDLPTHSLLWEQIIAPEDFFFSRDFIQATIDNRGEANFILQKNNFKSRKKTHYYEIHTCNGSTPTALSSIEMGERLTYDVFFKADNANQQLIGAGLYSTDNIERSEGVFYIKQQVGNNLLKFTPFQETFLKNFMGRDYKEGKGLKEVSIQKTIIRRDGGVLLIAERNKQQYRRSGTPSNSRIYYDDPVRTLVDFYYDEVFVYTLHPDGEEHWETILHKKQYSQDDNGIYSSFFLFETPGHLRFLFNDEIRSENTVSEYVINGLGSYNRNSLFSTTNLDLRLRFNSATQIDAHTVIIPSEKRNYLKLVRLRY